MNKLEIENENTKKVFKNLLGSFGFDDSFNEEIEEIFEQAQHFKIVKDYFENKEFNVNRWGEKVPFVEFLKLGNENGDISSENYKRNFKELYNDGFISYIPLLEEISQTNTNVIERKAINLVAYRMKKGLDTHGETNVLDFLNDILVNGKKEHILEMEDNIETFNSLVEVLKGMSQTEFDKDWKKFDNILEIMVGEWNNEYRYNSSKILLETTVDYKNDLDNVLDYEDLFDNLQEDNLGICSLYQYCKQDKNEFVKLYDQKYNSFDKIWKEEYKIGKTQFKEVWEENQNVQRENIKKYFKLFDQVLEKSLDEDLEKEIFRYIDSDFQYTQGFDSAVNTSIPELVLKNVDEVSKGTLISILDICNEFSPNQVLEEEEKLNFILEVDKREQNNELPKGTTEAILGSMWFEFDCDRFEGFDFECETKLDVVDFEKILKDKNETQEFINIFEKEGYKGVFGRYKEDHREVEMVESLLISKKEKTYER